MSPSLFPLAKLTPVDGHLLAGVRVDKHLFLARVRASQLVQIAPDPRQTEKGNALAEHPELNDLAVVRRDIQRLFEGAKERNVPSYAGYIERLAKGGDGLTPPIILYSPAELPVEADDQNGLGFIQCPWDRKLAALDGETQLAARIDAMSAMPETKEGFVAVLVVHGQKTKFARQAFHDLNVLGVRPNAALAISMDARDPVTLITQEVATHVSFFLSRVNGVRRQLRRGDKEVVTLSALRGACVTLAEGIGGVRYGTKPVPVADDRVPQLKKVAVEWFDELTRAIGPSIENRDNTVAAAPAVLAALGAVGRELITITDDGPRATRKRELIEGLREVDWNRGRHWEGVVGKYTAKGRLTIGGSKETAYAVYAALTDPATTAYGAIRNSVSSAVVASPAGVRP